MRSPPRNTSAATWPERSFPVLGSTYPGALLSPGVRVTIFRANRVADDGGDFRWIALGMKRAGTTRSGTDDMRAPPFTLMVPGWGCAHQNRSASHSQTN